MEIKKHTKGALAGRVEMKVIDTEINAAEGVGDDEMTQNENGAHHEQDEKDNLAYSPFDEAVSKINDINEINGTKPDQDQYGKNIDMDHEEVVESDIFEAINETSLGNNSDAYSILMNQCHNILFP